MLLTSKPGRTVAAAILLSTIAATAAQAAPISFTVSGTADYGYYYDYGTGTYEDRSGYTLQVTVSGDDADLPVSSNTYSYAGAYSRDDSSFNVTYDVEIFDTNGALVDSRSFGTSTINIYNYASTSQSGYWDQFSGSAYDGTGDIYVSAYGNSPTSLFPTDGAITSLSALEAIATGAFNGGYMYFYTYDSNENAYYDVYNATAGAQYSAAPVVPLPAGGLLLLTGFGALAVARKRKG